MIVPSRPQTTLAPMLRNVSSLSRPMPFAPWALLAGIMAVGACDVPQERASAATQRTDAAIIGGTAASNGQFPAVVALYLGAQSSLCTGTLIEPDVVLTAAHCVQGETAATLSVIIDRENLNSPGGGGRTVGVTKRVVHPNYSGNNGSAVNHDVGLVFLDEALTDRQAIPINRDPAARQPGTTSTLAGFGIRTAGGSDSGRLYSVQKTINDCDDVENVIEDVYNFSFPLDQTRYICWDQTTNTGKCQGDSGGPTFVEVDGQTVVAGITSFGDGDGCRYFGIDTAVDSELAFIDQEIGKWKCGANGTCTAGCSAFGLPVDPDCPTCANDDACEDGNYCSSEGVCMPSPFSTGGLGAACAASTDCASNLCTTGPGGQFCVDYCTIGDATTCPESFDCTDIGQGAQGVCWHFSGGDGGCSAAPGTGPRGAPSPAPFAAIGLGALLWTFARRDRGKSTAKHRP